MASNSLLESLVFAKRAATEINGLDVEFNEDFDALWNEKKAYLEKEGDMLANKYKDLVWKEIERR